VGGGRPGWGPCTACSLAKYGRPTAVSAAVIRRSVVWQTPTTSTIESDVPVFWETESIRIANRNALTAGALLPEE